MDLIKKLHLDPQKALHLINAPTDCRAFFGSLETTESFTGPAAQIVVFVYSAMELASEFNRLLPHVSPDTLYWICYPKKSGAIASDLIQDKSWAVVFQSGFRGQTSVSVNDNWSGFRITSAPKKAPSICDLPMEQRNAEGIDFVNRTAQLPPDAAAVLGAHPGLVDYFNSLSFSHKKEHILAITEAKQAETRKRRIEKMAAMLLEKRAAVRK